MRDVHTLYRVSFVHCTPFIKETCLTEECIRVELSVYGHSTHLLISLQEPTGP
jgi:hypothetical protein